MSTPENSPKPVDSSNDALSTPQTTNNVASPAPTTAPVESAPKSPAVSDGAAKASNTDVVPSLPAEMREMVRLVIDDTLPIVAAQLDMLGLDVDVIDKTTRYGYKSHKGDIPAAVFHQAFKLGKWLPLEARDVTLPETAILFPESTKAAAELAKNTDMAAVFVIDYHTDGPLPMVVRLASVLAVVRDNATIVARDNETKKQAIARAVNESALVPHKMAYAVHNMSRREELQAIMTKELTDTLTNRERVMSNYAGAMFQSDVREACISQNIHNKVAADDRDGAVGAMRCFRIVRSPRVTVRVEELTLVDLAKCIERYVDVPETCAIFRDALFLMNKPRQAGQAVVVVVRTMGGVLSTLASTHIQTVDLAELGAGAEIDRAERAEFTAKMKAEFVRAKDK